MCRGSLCYLETDSFPWLANQGLWKTDSCSAIGPPFPGTHSTINGHVIVSSGSAKANYTAPILCSDLFSPTDPLHAYKDRHTHTYKSLPTPKNVTTRD